MNNDFKAIKKKFFAGVVEKLMMIPWIPFAISFVGVSFLMVLLEIIVAGVAQYSQPVRYGAVMWGLFLAVGVGLVAGFMAKLSAEHTLKQKLTKMGWM